MSNRDIQGKRKLARARNAGPKRMAWLVAAAIVLSAVLFAPAATSDSSAIGPGSLDRPTGSLPHTGDAFNRTHWSAQVGDSITLRARPGKPTHAFRVSGIAVVTAQDVLFQPLDPLLGPAP